MHKAILQSITNMTLGQSHGRMFESMPHYSFSLTEQIWFISIYVILM